LPTYIVAKVQLGIRENKRQENIEQIHMTCMHIVFARKIRSN